jgi:FAD/FMN-containing dehydrogenase
LTDRNLLPLQSSNLTSIVEYDPPNQTVTVEAGTPLAALQEALKANRQWLPIRPFRGPEATVGGLAALAACGPERLRYGAARDLLLGLRFVSGTGRPVSAGGRVVKNVAGYDLGRLLVGSAGTLGFLTDLTLRVSSIPETCRAVHGCGPLETIARVAETLSGSNLDPTMVVARPLNTAVPENGTGRKGGLWRLTVGLEGFGEIVEAQAGRCTDLFAGSGLTEQTAEDYPLVRGLFEHDEEALSRFAFLLRADLPLDKVAPFVREITPLLKTDSLFVDFGCGRIRASLSDLSDETWEGLCTLAGKMGGYVLLEKAEDAFKKRRDVFGPGRRAWTVMHKIKEALDPHNIFAPGRLPGRR